MKKSGNAAKHHSKRGTPLADEVAVVIGGSRGIGAAVAVELARLGANVVICFLRNEDAANNVSREIRHRWKRHVLLIRTNVGDAEGVEELFKLVKARFKRIDHLVFCAALTVFRPLFSLTHLQIRRVLDINLTGFILSVQRGTELMTKGGNIIAMSSLGSQRYFKNYGPMGIAKAGIESAVRYLAVELAPRKIRVNAVSAGVVDTDGVKAVPSYFARRKALVHLTPAGRAGSAKDIAQVVAFLCHGDSSWITGQTIIADGGLSLCLEGATPGAVSRSHTKSAQ